MKLFAAFLGGFALTLASFGGGIMLAVVYFSAQPVVKPGPSVDTAEMWPDEPVRVDDDDKGELQRLPARPSAAGESTQNKAAAGGNGDGAGEGSSAWDGERFVIANYADDQAVQGIDGLTTAAIGQEERPDDPHRISIMDAHVDWCANRYRSYRPEDNSYQPYGAADRAPCLSPYFDGERSAQVADSGDGFSIKVYPTRDEPQYVVGSNSGDAGPVLTRDHIQDCFDRYRSYRPEDNTYQPYGGGRRQQCM